MGSSSCYLQGFLHAGGVGFLPSTVLYTFKQVVFLHPCPSLFWGRNFPTLTTCVLHSLPCASEGLDALYPRKLTWTARLYMFDRKFLFQCIIFSRSMVSLSIHFSLMIKRLDVWHFMTFHFTGQSLYGMMFDFANCGNLIDIDTDSYLSFERSHFMAILWCKCTSFCCKWIKDLLVI